MTESAQDVNVQALLEQLIRMINPEPIEFGVGGVPMEVAEKVLGMKRSTILNKMESGKLDIGIVEKAQKKRGVRAYRSSYISPKKLYELTGYIWKGGGDS